MNPLHDPFKDREILHLWALTRDYDSPLERQIVRALAAHSVTHSHGLIGTVTVTNAPTTEAMVNLWLGDNARGVLIVRIALNRLIAVGVLTEQRIGNVLQLTIAPSILPLDSRDCEAMWGLGELEEAA